MVSDKLDSMRYAGKINLQAINYGFGLAEPGVTLKELDEGIEWYITHAGCKPAFKNYWPAGYPKPYPNTACISPNDVVVHGIPGDYVLKLGDLLTIDVGTENEGWFVDAARSRVIKSPLSLMTPKQADKCFQAQKLIDATEAIMDAQLAVIRHDCTFLQLIEAADAVAKSYGVVIAPEWGGHGIGNKVHLPPFVPNVIDKSKSKIKQQIATAQFGREKFIAGETYCIEPVVMYDNSHITIDDDGWTVRKQDGGLVAHTERCILICKNGYELLS